MSSVKRRELEVYLNEQLEVGRFRDYCPNGLQVQGVETVSRIVTGVTASMALIEAAIEARADALLVHHGYFWKGEASPLVGIKYHRIERLIKHGLNLFAYHLPLDQHKTLGNNAQLAGRLGLEIDGPLGEGPDAVGLVGHLAVPATANTLIQIIDGALGRIPQHIAPSNDRKIQRVAWCTGAAQGYIEQAVAQGADAYISGEISEPTVHIAREAGIHYFAAGHHATERYGVLALGEHLEAHFGIEHQFIDIDNPV